MGIKFNDFTIKDGTIYSQRLQDTSALDSGAIAICRSMLHELRRGRLTSRPKGRDFGADTSLGLPDVLLDAELSDELRDAIRAPGRFFCVTQRGQQTPFQINLVLPRLDERSFEDASNDPDAEARTIGTLLGISGAQGSVKDADAMMSDYERLWEARPFLATVVLPVCFDFQMIRIAADFSTCFAAAMLLE